MDSENSPKFNSGNKQKKVKVILLGASSVGKTSLVTYLINQGFSENVASTVGCSYFSHELKMDNGEIIKLQIWDTAGQERYQALAPVYIRGADCALIVYDTTDASSFTACDFWLQQVRTIAPKHAVVAMVGNKIDLTSERQVATVEGQRFASAVGSLFAETSALTGYGIQDLFKSVVSVIPEHVHEEKRLGMNQTEKSGCC